MNPRGKIAVDWSPKQLPLTLALIFAGLLIIYTQLLHQIPRINTASYEFYSTLEQQWALYFLYWIGIVAALVFGSYRLLQRKRPGLLLKPFLTASAIFSVTLLLVMLPVDTELAKPNFYYPGTTYLTGFALLFCGLWRVNAAQIVFHYTGRWILKLAQMPAWGMLALAMLWIAAITFLISAIFFQHIPVFHDSITQYIQGRIFSLGKLSWKLDFPAFFDIGFMAMRKGHWFSKYTPGHALFLAFGHFLGSPKLVMITISTLTTVVLYRTALEIYGKTTAKICLILCCMCVYYLVMSATYMNHVSHLFLLSLCVYFYFRFLRTHDTYDSLLLGLSLGMAFITRPYITLLFSLPFACDLLWQWVRGRERNHRAIAALIAGFMLFGLFLLYYQHVTTGSMLKTGYEQVHNNEHNPFSSKSFHRLTGEKLANNLFMASHRTAKLNTLMYGLPVPGLILLCLGIAWRYRCRKTQLLFLSMLTTILGHIPTEGYTDHFLGPRLIYVAIIPVLLISAKALQLVPACLRIMSPYRVRQSTVCGFAFMLLASLYFVSMQDILTHDSLYKKYGLSRKQAHPDVYYEVMDKIEKPALVFVAPAGKKKWFSIWYFSFAWNNPPLPTDEVIFAKGRTRGRQNVIEAYSGRHVYDLYKDEVIEIFPDAQVEEKTPDRQRRKRKRPRKMVLPR